MQRLDGMRPFLVVYATRSGHTRRVAERIVDRIRTLAHEAQLQDARTEALPPLERYSAVILAAGVHLGHHKPEMLRFVRARRDELAQVPTLFFSVSMTEAAAEDFHRPDDERTEARHAVQKLLADFVLETGWSPPKAVPVAGALTGSSDRRRALLRKLLRREVTEQPAGDVVFTDWAAVNLTVDNLVREAVERSRRLPPPSEAPEFRTALEGAVVAP